MISKKDRAIVEDLIAECHEVVAQGRRGNLMVKDELGPALRRIMGECDRLTKECNRMANDLEYLGARLERLDATESDDG
jgi:hypothetical protein